MIADSDSSKVVIWDGKKQILLCNFGEAEQGGWAISKVQEISVLGVQPKPEKILYTLHDFLSDAINAELPLIPALV